MLMGTPLPNPEVSNQSTQVHAPVGARIRKPRPEHSGNPERKLVLRQPVKETDFLPGADVEIGGRVPSREQNDIGSREARGIGRDLDRRAKSNTREPVAELDDAADVDFGVPRCECCHGQAKNGLGTCPRGAGVHTLVRLSHLSPGGTVGGSAFRKVHGPDGILPETVPTVFGKVRLTAAALSFSHLASGSGRSWNFRTLLVVPLRPSM